MFIVVLKEIRLWVQFGKNLILTYIKQIINALIKFFSCAVSCFMCQTEAFISFPVSPN